MFQNLVSQGINEGEIIIFMPFIVQKKIVK
jgi:hypothetical protein